jgi:hypothetical protein
MSKSPETEFSNLPVDLQIKIFDKSKIYLFDSPVTYDTFFKKNDLYKYGFNLDKSSTRYVIILTGKSGKVLHLKTINGKIFYLHTFVSTRDIKNDYLRYFDKNVSNGFMNDIIVSLRIEKWNNIKDYNYNISNSNKGKFNVILDTTDKGYSGRTEIINTSKSSSGGSKAYVKKEICGKLRCIYKIPGSRKEYIKYKGYLITVPDYKNIKKKA